MKTNKSYLKDARRDRDYWNAKNAANHRRAVKRRGNTHVRKHGGSATFLALSSIGFWQSAVNVAVVAIAIIIAAIV